MSPIGAVSIGAVSTVAVSIDAVSIDQAPPNRFGFVIKLSYTDIRRYTRADARVRPGVPH
jgi:hypothetical protein